MKSFVRCSLFLPVALMLSCISAGLSPASAQDLVRDPATGETERVVVTAEAPDAPTPEYAGGQVADGGRLGLLGNRSLFDTPFSTTDYTAKFIKNQQARTVGDLLLNSDPSVNTQWPRGSFVERYQIRGFAVSGDEASLNGLFGMAPSTLAPPEPFERVELFKGPNALLNGKVGSVGGSINYVTKRAGNAPNASVSLTYASPGQFGGQLDLGERFGPDKQFGVRFNGNYTDGDTEGDLQSQRLAVAALGLDYHWKGFRISGDVMYVETLNRAARSQVYAVGDLPYLRPPDAHKSFAQPYEYAGGDDTIGMGRVEYDLTDHVTLYAAGGDRFSHDRQSRGIPILVDGVFDARRGDFGTGVDEYLEWDDVNSEQVGGRALFTLGPTRHEFSVSANQLDATQGYDYRSIADPNADADPNGIRQNLYHPVRLPTPDFPHLIYKAPRASESTESSVAVADIVSALDERVQVILGGRLQRVESANYDQTTGGKLDNYDKSQLTPAYTLLVKPIRQLSLYGSYIEALEQGPTAPDDVSNARQLFPPNVTDQYEVGAKLDLGRFGLTLAWFQVTQPFAQTRASGTGVLTFVVDGEQRDRGVEFGAFGEPVKGVRLIGGVAYLDPRLQNTAGGLSDGQAAPGNSEFVVNFNAEWDLPFVPGLTLTGRANYQTSQYIDSTNTVEIPDWVRVDLGARYARKIAGRLTTLRVSCENVADRNYWASAANGYLLAQPRTFLSSLTVDF